MKPLPKVLPEPDRPTNVESHAQWLAGEGAGSWFVIEQHVQGVRIKRYSPNGKLECVGLFEGSLPFDGTRPYQIDYPSHCARVTVVQGSQRIQFIRIGDQ